MFSQIKFAYFLSNIFYNIQFYVSFNSILLFIYSFGGIFLINFCCLLIFLYKYTTSLTFNFYYKQFIYLLNIYISIQLFNLIYYNIFKIFIFKNIIITNVQLFFLDFIFLSNKLLLFFALFIIYLFILFINFKTYIISSKLKTIFFPFFFLILFFIFVLTFSLTFTIDLFHIFVLLECLNLILLVLIILNYNFFFFKLNIDLGIKYFLMSILTSIFFLFGLSCLYFTNLTLNLYKISIILQSLNLTTSYVYGYNIFFLLGLFFIILTFAIKLGLFPFHFWIIDLYENTTFFNLLFFSIFPKLAYIISFFFVFIHTYFYFKFWYIIIVILSISSIFIGSIGAIFELRLKSFLAYSTLVHFGFILLNLLPMSALSFSNYFLYSFSYLLSLFNLWIILIYLCKFTQKNPSLNLFDSLFFTSPILFWIFLILLLTWAGFPGTFGFYCKYYTLLGIINLNNYIIFFFIFISSLLSLVYYSRFIFLMLNFNKKKIQIIHQNIFLVQPLLPSININFFILINTTILVGSFIYSDKIFLFFQLLIYKSIF